MVLLELFIRKGNFLKKLACGRKMRLIARKRKIFL